MYLLNCESCLSFISVYQYTCYYVFICSVIFEETLFVSLTLGLCSVSIVLYWT